MKPIQDTDHLDHVAHLMEARCSDHPQCEGAAFVTDPVARRILRSAAKRLRRRADVLDLRAEEQRLAVAQERVRIAARKVGRK